MKKRWLAPAAAGLLLALCACRPAAPEEPVRTLFSPAPSPTASREPAPTGGRSVHTDYSRYESASHTALPEEVYTRWYGEETTDLKPLEGGYGGALIPFDGSLATNALWESKQYKKGLMTADGRVVVDPVYFDVRFPANEEGDRLPLLLLSKAVVTGRVDGYLDGDERWALADMEGRWCTDFRYLGSVAGDDGIFLVWEQGYECRNLDGTVRWSGLWTDLGYEAGTWPSWYEAGPVWEEDLIIPNWWLREQRLDAQTGKVMDVAYNPGGQEEYLFYLTSEGVTPAGPTWNNWGYVDREGNWVIEPQFYSADAFYDGTAIVWPTERSGALIDRAGNRLLYVADGEVKRHPDGNGGWWYGEYYRKELDDGGQSSILTAAYDNQFQALALPPGDWDAELGVLDGGDGWVFGVMDGQIVFYRAGKWVAVQGYAGHGWWNNKVRDGLAVVLQEDRTCALYRLADGKCILAGGLYRDIEFMTDSITGETYLLARLSWGGEGLLMDTDGRTRTAFEKDETARVLGGTLQLSGARGVQVWDRTGRLVLCRRGYLPMDD